MKTIYISTLPSVEPTSFTFLPEVLDGFSVAREGKLDGFSVACEGEDKFAVACEGKLTFLAEASPEVNRMFSKRSVEKLPDFGEDIAEVNFSEQIAEKLDGFSVDCEGKSVKNVIFIPENSYLTQEISEKTSIPRKVTKHKNWIFQQKDYIYENQIKIIDNLLSYATANSFSSTLCSDEKMINIETSISKEEKIALREIYNKMSGYKYQDTKKNIYNPELFVNIFYVLKKLSESKLKCYYCNENIKVLYENKRDPIQWSLERMDNKEGHNCNNVVIACLKCNLRRKTMLMQRYVETKKMVKVIKLS